jgi:hypothetical protein
VFGMCLINQHRITRASVCARQLAFALFAQEFEIIYCQRLAIHIHFVRPCIHSLVHLPQEVVWIGPPIVANSLLCKAVRGDAGLELEVT